MTDRSSSSSSPRRDGSSSQSFPNLNSSNPYEILGVPQNATAQQIKVSYRKLALQYHPDRLSPEATGEEKEGAHKSFTKIGHAYEILSDETRRQEYDAEQQQTSTRRRSFDRGPFSMHDTFFGSFGMRNSRRHHSAFDEFMDPFELFNQFFSNEMDLNDRRNGSSRSSRSRSAFDDDLFFSGFGRSSMMSTHLGMMDEMNSMINQMHSSSIFNTQQSMNGGSFFSSSRSSSNRGRSQSISTSTRTTMINGVRTTVTERTVVRPDGRVEHHVETTGGGQNEPLPSSSRRAIEYDGMRSRSRRHY